MWAHATDDLLLTPPPIFIIVRAMCRNMLSLTRPRIVSALLAAALLTGASGCGGSGGPVGTKYGDGAVAGSGVLTTRRIDVHFFEGVKIDHDFDINIAQGSSPRVIITADDNITRLLKPRINDNILVPEFEQGFRTRKPVRLRIETPDLERIDHSGRGTVILDNLSLSNLALKVSGDGDVSGLGRVDKLWIEAGGDGNLQLEDVTAKQVDVLLTGKGQVTVMATQKLEATNIGRGEIIYAGNPPETEIDNSGKGTIRKK